MSDLDPVSAGGRRALPRCQDDDHRSLVEREALLRVILDLTADTIVSFDPDLRYDYVNDRTVAVVGLEREGWIGRTQAELGYPPEEVAEREARLRRVFDTGEPLSFIDEFENLEGRRFYETQLFPQPGDDGVVAHVLVVSRDITDRMIAEERLVRAAHTDALTGLGNRTALISDIQDALDVATRSDSSTAVLLIDLDHFKLVNDSLGHAVGDAFLRHAAERIRACVGADDLVARHGGDEFVIVVHELDEAKDAVELAERIIAAFREPVECEGNQVATTASIGIAYSDLSPERRDAHDLIREADTAMYVAKAAGRDGFAVFDDGLLDAAQERFRITTDLRVALHGDELDVWYQPEVDLADGSIRAVEALLRWHHPSGETYPAGRFIDIAAETGLIIDMGYWVLDRVCEQAARWAADPLTIRMNLAPRQLADPELLARLDHAVARHRIGVDQLCVEITETTLLQDDAIVRENLAGLSGRGISIAIDDFGTGYASLTYLRRYHVDVIKIDRSFVTDIATNARDAQLTGAVISLAHHLDMTVTAEGIEDPDQARVLRELGCTSGQGYLYSPAVPADEIDRQLAERSR